MVLNTRHFGEIHIDDEKIITFEDGLPAFENIKKFAVIQNSDPEIPLHWLQAIDEPLLAFVITNPFLFKTDYEFDIPERVIRQLDIEKLDDAMVFAIAVVPDNIQNTTINLGGPIIINIKTKKGKQVILESKEYPVKYRIFQQTVEETIG